MPDTRRDFTAASAARLVFSELNGRVFARRRVGIIQAGDGVVDRLTGFDLQM